MKNFDLEQFQTSPLEDLFDDNESFITRHVGCNLEEQNFMLENIGYTKKKSFIEEVIPLEILEDSISRTQLPENCNEQKALREIEKIAEQNICFRSLIGLGYHETSTPSIIKRQILENPSWYTAYTPYQAEISQGRLEALFNFQTLISELTGLPITNSSLLDEGSAAAEAMSLSYSACKKEDAKVFLVDSNALPQTLEILRTRAEPLGIKIKEIDPHNSNLDEDVFGVMIQLPGSNGRLWNPKDFIEQVHKSNALVTVAIDPLAQVLMCPIGDLGADIAIGSAQRLGVPLGFGGPHAAFFATKEQYKRQIPGRIVGKSRDTEGNEALRLALQTREQHIRRDKATSNICTAQVLLAVISSFYAIYYGPEGLTKIASKIVMLRSKLESGIKALGYEIEKITRFDTIEVFTNNAPTIHENAYAEEINLRVLPIGKDAINSIGFGITLDELSNHEEIEKLLSILAKSINQKKPSIKNSFKNLQDELRGIPLRKKDWLTQSVFHLYRSETELMRYIQYLGDKDFSLTHGMIPLGSCTMKLNAAAELTPISWKKFGSIHPFVPDFQAKGYQKLTNDLERWLGDLTGFAGISLQPNAGSQGELAGLLVIRAWHKSRGENHRNVCLIPTSAHGTNPASSVMAGMQVVSIECDSDGNIDLGDLNNKAQEYSSKLAALMVTYPSTHGVFEPEIRRICQIIHLNGGQVYLDGANLNAQVGLCKPGNYGADVCHLNLHKTFCIPHGGGGPGIGPIGVAEHLLPFLPGHPIIPCGGQKKIGSISAAPWGSAGILPITWMYIRMMGEQGLKEASISALLSANYIAHKLASHYPILFQGPNGRVAHECILDLRPLKKATGIEVDDIAKRLMDYGFHAPTVSWPVAGTLMVEPTESESLKELNRFCDAMISIRREIASIENKLSDPKNNVLKKAPHTLQSIASDTWDRPYSKQEAAFPLGKKLKNKFWPAVSRINNAFGDRNLICSCAPIDELTKITATSKD